MRKFFVLLSRELGAYFHSPIAYVVMCFFLFLSGVSFHGAVVLVNSAPTPMSVLEAFFNSVFFWFAFVLIFPLITMRLFSEEYKMGTIEPLMAAPVGDAQVVLAKFFGAVLFYCILWVPTLIYFLVFQWQTGQPAADSNGAYVGSYVILLLIGMFYISIGCLASALTKNQIIAAIISFCAITLMFFMGLLTFFILSVSSFLRELTSYLSSIQHMAEFSSGIFDTRPIVFYLSMTAFFLFLTLQVFQRRRWAV